MHKISLIVAAATLAACDRGTAPPETPANEAAPEEPQAAQSAPAGEGRNEAAAAPAAAPAGAGPCLVQDGEPLKTKPLRAVGTEPFWGARIEGRCVTYSTPEDQAGTRVWTTFRGTAEQGSWTGALNGKRFELRTRPQPDCSDGMSDTVYPIAVTLLVGGEQRRGCALPQ